MLALLPHLPLVERPLAVANRAPKWYRESNFNKGRSSPLICGPSRTDETLHYVLGLQGLRWYRKQCLDIKQHSAQSLQLDGNWCDWDSKRWKANRNVPPQCHIEGARHEGIGRPIIEMM